MTAIVKGKSLSRSFMLFCCGVAILLLDVEQQAIAEGASVQDVANTQKASSSNLPGEEQAATSSIQDTHLVIRLRDRRVYVYHKDQLKVSYPIAVGKAGWETPKGIFEVIEMQRNPAWQHPWNGKIIPPGPENPLGARWIGFWTDGKNFIGFHGTPQEHLVGQAVSHGCIRMLNKDVLALYTQVGVGTPVKVEP